MDIRTNSIIICDIDGTICDSSKRLEEVGFDPSKPRDQWPTKWGDHSKDAPFYKTIKIIQDLYEYNDIWMVTIRHPMKETKKWLNCNSVFYDKLIELGIPGDKRIPAYIKETWLNSLKDSITKRIVCAFEDSPSMIKMFRSYGILTFDVGQFNGSM